MPSFANAACPITGKATSAAFFVETDKGRIHACSPECASKIRADVDKAYKRAFPRTEAIANKTCPVTGAPITAASPSIVLQGRLFRVATEACVANARESSQIVLTRCRRLDDSATPSAR